MATKLSQIAPAGSPPALTDQIVGVSGGTTDLLYSLSQIARFKVTSDIDFYVDPVHGNDSNNGLTSGTAFLTPQACWNNIALNYDGAGFAATINLLPGTYNAASYPNPYIIQIVPVLGFTEIAIVSSTGVPSDVILECGFGAQGAFSTFNNSISCDVTVFYCTLQCSDLSNVVYLDMEGQIFFQLQTCVVGPAGPFSTFFFGSGYGSVVHVNQCTITGGGGWCWYASECAEVTNNTATMTGTQSWAHGVFGGDNAAYLLTDNVTVTGTVTGPQFDLTTGTRLNLFAGNVSQVPGNSFGTVDLTSQIFEALPGSAYLYPNPNSLNTQTGTSYTLALSDQGGRVEMNNAGANTLTVPTNASVAFPVGIEIKVTQLGAGATTIAAAGGVTGDNFGALSGQWDTVVVYKRGTNEWVMTGA